MSLIRGTLLAGAVIVVLAPQTALTQTPAGSIVGWGEQVFGADLDGPFSQIAAGAYHSLGLRTEGSIAAWGRNTEGQASVPPPNANFVAIAAGWYHSLGLKSDGVIIAWGCNGLDFEDLPKCQVPAPNSDFTAIAAGASHSLGLKSDGSVVAWGCTGFPGDDLGQCDVPMPNS